MGFRWECGVCWWLACVLWVVWVKGTYLALRAGGVTYRAVRRNMLKSQSVVRMESWTVGDA
jgi:photosystem II stability/assembly factor-like uncharacterized protein